MVLPYIQAGGAALQGVGSIVGPILAARASRENAAMQRAGLDAQYQTLYEARQANRVAQELSRRNLDAQLADTVNARGGRTHYDPVAKEWRVLPSASEQSLIGASDREEMQRLSSDAAMQRTGRAENRIRRLNEGAAASPLLAELSRPSPYSAGRMTSLLTDRARSGINEGFDETQRQALVQGIRSQTGMGDIVSALAKSRGRALANANTAGAVEGITQSEALKDSRRSSAGNTYNMLASRAQNTDDVPFSPSSLPNDAISVLAARAGGATKGFETSGDLINSGALGVTRGGIGLADLSSKIKPDFNSSFLPVSIGEGMGKAGRGLFDLWKTIFNPVDDRNSRYAYARGEDQHAY